MKNVLHNRYTLTKKLGSGTHGISYLAFDEQEKQDVVIKRLRQELTPENRKKWPKESRMLQRLAHPQIPKFIDFFEAEVELELLPHLVQEYIPGQNLLEVMKQKAITPQECIQHVISILEILVYLQSVSPPVVHRDIKPENIILHEENQKLYLIDFGISTTMQGQTFGHTMAAGTLGYQSKEQIEGDPGLASDVYSLGVVAVLWMSGRTIEDLHVGLGKIKWREYLPHCPPQILNFLEEMLHPSTRNRYKNAKEALSGAKKSLSPSLEKFQHQQQEKYSNRHVVSKEKDWFKIFFWPVAIFFVLLIIIFGVSFPTIISDDGILDCTKGEHTLDDGFFTKEVNKIHQYSVKQKCVLHIRDVTIRERINVSGHAKLIVENSTIDTISTTGSAEIVLTKSTIQELYHKSSGSLVVDSSTIGECVGFGCEHRRIDLLNVDEHDDHKEHGEHGHH